MLDINNSKKQIIKYSIMSGVFLLFALIYEAFSHGVYSGYMMCAFLIPLILGVVLYSLIYFKRINKYFSNISSQVYNSGIITLALGSIINGVLEIYGTTNSLVNYYLFGGIILFIISVIINIIYNIMRKDEVKI